jgi:hypothetical protein
MKSSYGSSYMNMELVPGLSGTLCVPVVNIYCKNCHSRRWRLMIQSIRTVLWFCELIVEIALLLQLEKRGSDEAGSIIIVISIQ